MTPIIASMSRRTATLQAMSTLTRQKLNTTTMLQKLFMSTAVDGLRGEGYRAVVVGAGPAGIAVVGNLLEAGVKPVAWVDGRFEGGRLNASYREVPSNTKTKLFLAFADALEPFRQIITSSSSSKSAYKTLESLAQDKGCQIKYAADLCLQLTRGLANSPDVHLVQGELAAAKRDAKAEKWQLSFKDDKSTTSASMLVLCTGSHPKPPRLPEQYTNLTPLDLDTALSPTKLADHLKDTSKPITVALIGASHSAILVLRNLYNLASSTHPNLSIKWFSRHPLRYAEEREGWIKRDNTGLKGDTAQWAKEVLEPHNFHKSDIAKYVEPMECADDEKGMYAKHLPGCDIIVEAVGFDKNDIPEVIEGQGKVDVVYDNLSGAFKDKSGRVVKGLYGAGIAFPEKVTSPEGDVEYAVGMWKFMRYLRRVVPSWS